MIRNRDEKRKQAREMFLASATAENNYKPILLRSIADIFNVSITTAHKWVADLRPIIQEKCDIALQTTNKNITETKCNTNHLNRMNQEKQEKKEQTQNFLADHTKLAEETSSVLEIPNLKFNLKNFLENTWGKNILPIKSLQKDKCGKTVRISEADRQKAFIEMTKKANAPIKIYNNHAYVYNGAIYIQISENGHLCKDVKNFIIKWQVKACDDEQARKHAIINKLKKDLHIFSEAISLNDDTNVRRYVFLNGVLEIKPNGNYNFSNKFSDSIFETFQLPYEYNPSLKPHKFLEALKTMVYDEDDIKTLQEFMGYCLTHTHSYGVFMLFCGIANSCEFVVENLLRTFFHPSKISRVPAYKLKNFSRLDGMYVNIGGEIKTNNSAACIENIKRYYDNAFTEKNHKPKLILSCHELPRIRIRDRGFFRRLLVIEFKNSISEEDIRSFSTRFLDERSALFNFALEGLERLNAQRGDFTLSLNSKKIRG